MGEHSTEDELVALEHAWAQAVLENDMDKLEHIVAQEYTLAANNFPGGRTRLSRQEWWGPVSMFIKPAAAMPPRMPFAIGLPSLPLAPTGGVVVGIMSAGVSSPVEGLASPPPSIRPSKPGRCCSTWVVACAR
jgi:hypothetical protein